MIRKQGKSLTTHKNSPLRLPSLDLNSAGLTRAFGFNADKEAKIPNASLIYGCAAAGLIGLSLFFAFKGLWFTALLTMLPAGCLLGFALYFLRFTK